MRRSATLRGTPGTRSGTLYTLGTAARAAGVSKSTIHRAIKRGTISARSREAGGYEIDPAELHRVFPPVSAGSDGSSDLRDGADGDGVPGTGSNGFRAERLERSGTPPAGPGNDAEAVRNPSVALQHETELALARAEAQVESLKAILVVERERTEEVRRERDRWAGVAEANQRLLTDLSRKPDSETTAAETGLRGIVRKWLRVA